MKNNTHSLANYATFHFLPIYALFKSVILLQFLNETLMLALSSKKIINGTIFFSLKMTEKAGTASGRESHMDILPMRSQLFFTKKCYMNQFQIFSLKGNGKALEQQICVSGTKLQMYALPCTSSINVR